MPNAGPRVARGPKRNTECQALDLAMTPPCLAGFVRSIHRFHAPSFSASIDGLCSSRLMVPVLLVMPVLWGRGWRMRAVRGSECRGMRRCVQQVDERRKRRASSPDKRWRAGGRRAFGFGLVVDHSVDRGQLLGRTILPHTLDPLNEFRGRRDGMVVVGRCLGPAGDDSSEGWWCCC